MNKREDFKVGSEWSDGSGILRIVSEPDERGYVSYVKTAKFSTESQFAKALKPFKQKT